MDMEERSIELIDMNEEIFAVSSSSAADTAFDAAIGCIEDIIVGDGFQKLQQNFKEKYYLEFDISDENKLVYTQIFNDYVDLLETHLEHQLLERIPDFNMNNFIQLLMQHKEEVPGDIFDVILPFTDFIAFKEMFLEYKADKEGSCVDLGLVVTPLVTSHRKHCSSSISQ